MPARLTQGLAGVKLRRVKLIVLGSGTSVPHPRRCSPAYWLATDEGTMLLDIGTDAPHRMAQEELDWPNLDGIWISHFHLDHLGGLAPYLFGARWAPQMNDRRKPLRIFGPQGLAALIGAFNDANNYKLLAQRFPVEIIEVKDGEEFQIFPGLRGAVVSTPHTSESLALRLNGQHGKTLVYSSDTGFSEQLIDFAKRVNLLLLECSFRRNKPLQTHLELADAMKIITGSEPETAMLTHLYPEWEVGTVAGEAAPFWKGKVVEAMDGLRLEL